MQLLKAKFYIPPVKRNSLPRPALLEQLDAGINSKLTLISAPAGFGKTSILSEWIHSEGVADSSLKFAWLSLDKDDNDLKSFLVYLVGSLQTMDERIGQGLIDGLQTADPKIAEAVLTTLLNEVASESISFFLCFDDYHVIESKVIDDAVMFLINHLPPHMHIAIASRIEPTFPLSRLRASGYLTELRAADLRFVKNEVASFFNKSLGIYISSKELKILETRTEGWITGLQLASIAIKGLGQNHLITDFIHNFSGSHRYIIDYLVDEVLNQQSSDIKEFLLQTSILKGMSASLCNSVIRCENSQTILEHLEAANLFLIPLDDERCWYRYHHLFADILKNRLQQTMPDRIPQLNRLAGLWHKNEKNIEEAFSYAQLSLDKDLSIQILEDDWTILFFRGDLIKLKGWLDSLEREYIKKSISLNMAYCWIYAMSDNVDKIHGRINTVKKLLTNLLKKKEQLPSQLIHMPSVIETMNAIIHLNKNEPLKAKGYAKKAINLIPADMKPAWRNIIYAAAAYRLAEAYSALGENDKACSLLTQELEMIKDSKNFYGTANTVLKIVSFYKTSGKIQDAIIVCQNMVDHFLKKHWEKKPPIGLVYIALAELQLTSGDSSSALKNLETGQKLGERIQFKKLLDMAEEVKSKLNRITPNKQPLLEPLTNREIEVLQLIAKGFSNQEISDQLFLALSTVKGHNQNIFGKLSVQRRTEAIVRAKELKIL